MTTQARIHEEQSPHWYSPDGEPCHTQIAKNGEPRKTTLADARKLGLVPSVTSIIDSVLRKPALEAWRIEQALLACLTTPQGPGEGLDAFVQRVLHTERVQDEERKAAAGLGSAIHAAMDSLAMGLPAMVPPEILPYVEPAWNFIRERGEFIASEVVIVGQGYAGRTDLVQDCHDYLLLTDFKSSKKKPKESYPEHRMQLAAYAAGLSHRQMTRRTANLYISTTEPGQFTFCENPGWLDDFNLGFYPCLQLWQWMNDYKPLCERGSDL